jgi:uroporphyrinogen-III synthase
MQKNNIQILSTRPLHESLISEAKQKNIYIEVLSFIDTAPVLQSVAVQQEIEQALLQSATVVFTSMNAVEAVAGYMTEMQQHDWEIYCIGNTTAKLVKKYFGENAIAGTTGSAAALGDLIVDDNNSDQIIFFCGDQRRDELPQILRDNGIEVNEIVVYHTIATPHKVQKGYSGILFFSPSAVDSFFSKNKVSGQTILFAIGSTTADTIKNHSTSQVIISDQPGKENLLKKVINYFGNSGG